MSMCLGVPQLVSFHCHSALDSDILNWATLILTLETVAWRGWKLWKKLSMDIVLIFVKPTPDLLKYNLL